MSPLGRGAKRRPRDAQSVPYKLACPCDRLAGSVRSWHTCLLFIGWEGVPIGLLDSCPYQVTLSTVTPDRSLPGVLRNETSRQKMWPGAPGTTPLPPRTPNAVISFLFWGMWTSSSLGPSDWGSSQSSQGGAPEWVSALWGGAAPFPEMTAARLEQHR